MADAAQKNREEGRREGKGQIRGGEVRPKKNIFLAEEGECHPRLLGNFSARKGIGSLEGGKGEKEPRLKGGFPPPPE